MSLLLKTYLEREHTFRTWSIYLVEMNDMFFVYFQCRSSIYMWRVRQHGSTRFDKTQHKASSLCRKLMSWKIIYGYGSILSPWRNIKLFIFQKKTPIIILNWNKIIATLILLFHISQQPRLSYSTCIPQSFRFMMVSYEPKSPNLVGEGLLPQVVN
jgi:hypothetical protein